MNSRTIWSAALGLILAGGTMVGCIRPVGTPTVPIPPATNTPTTVPAGPCTNAYGLTCTYTPNLTVSPSSTSTRTPTPVPSATAPLSATSTFVPPTASFTPSPTVTHTPVPPTASATASSSATATADPSVPPTSTPTATATRTIVSTSTVTFVPTATYTPVSGCVTMGTHDPSPVITIAVEPNYYLARAYPAGTICGTGFNNFQAFVGNFDSIPDNLEVSVYDNGTRVADTVLTIPASSQGWVSAPLPAFTIPCGDQVVLVAHSQGPTIFLGAAYGTANCDSEVKPLSGTMPSSYPDPAFLTSGGSSGWCYEMSLDSCASGTPATPTPTGTATAVPSATPTTTPHMTPTISVPGSGIFWGPAEIGSFPGVTGWLSLAVNGSPESTAGVTLTTPSGNVPFTYSGVNGSMAAYSPASSFTYIPGGTYTMTTVTSIGTATASLVAPGPVSIAPDGSQASWTYEGNEDYVTVQELFSPYNFTLQTYNLTSDVDSPYSIPASAYPASGNYSVFPVAQSSTYNVTNAAAGSRFTVTCWNSLDVMK